MANSEPISLHWLVLHPRPLTQIPAQDDEGFAAELLKEGTAVLDNGDWHSEKHWHENTRASTTTTMLPDSSWKAVRGDGSATEEPAAAAPKKKKGFWGGSSEPAREDDGIHWHRRVTTLTGEVANYQALWSALGERHCEQEIEYIPTLSKVLPVEDKIWMKLYNLPFPTTNRSFLEYVRILSPSPDRFLCVSFPVEDDRRDAESKHLEKHHVRGRYCSVEEVRKLDNGNVVWRCASMSTPGGSIPIRIAESHMAGSLASAVPPFLSWLEKRLPSSGSNGLELRRTVSRGKRMSVDGLPQDLSLKNGPSEVGATA